MPRPFPSMKQGRDSGFEDQKAYGICSELAIAASGMRIIVKNKLCMLGLVLLAAIAGLAWWGLTHVRTSYGYSLKSEFATLPADDAQFRQWLISQPGVIPHTVHIERIGPKGTVLKVTFIHTRDMLNRPAFPAMDEACRNLGYGSPVSGFHDSDQTSTRTSS